jgi:hypothetical protein
MATLAEIANLAQDESFISRIAAAIGKAATDVINEDPGTTNHANRLLWAKAAMADIDGLASEYAWTIVQNATIQTSGVEATDNDIQFVVNSNVNSWASAA